MNFKESISGCCIALPFIKPGCLPSTRVYIEPQMAAYRANYSFVGVAHDTHNIASGYSFPFIWVP